jgi:protein TonB
MAMFGILLESAAPRRRALGGTIGSVVVHTAVVAGAIAATHQTAIRLQKPEELAIVYHAPAAPPPPLPAAPRTGGAVPSPTAAPVVGPVIVPPVDMRDGIPPVDLGAVGSDAPPTFAAAPVARQGGEQASSPAPGAGQPFTDREVDQPAMARPDNPVPPYPEPLRAAGRDGEALLQFVVDTAGRAEPGSVRVLQATDPLFGEAVRATLPRMRFIPATVAGRPVRMLVQQRYAFGIGR